MEELEIDHIDPQTKTMQPVTALMARAELREAELAKCQVLCAECHKAKTAAERRAKIVIVHGRNVTYDRYGCRCAECREANTGRSRRYRARLSAA